MFKKILYVVGGLLFVAAIAAAVGLGGWAYRLNTQLVEVQADYQALESEYSILESEYGDAKAEFEEKSSQADADLEKAMAEVAKLTNEAEKLQNENERLRAQLSEIQDKVAMLNDFWFLSESSFERKVDASDDEQLKELYAKLQESEEFEDLIELMSYMIQSLADVSRVSWQPISFVESHVETGTPQ